MTYVKTATRIGLTILSMTTVMAEGPQIESSMTQALDNQLGISPEAFSMAEKLYQIMEPYILDSDIDACAVGLGCHGGQISEENKRKLIVRFAQLIHGGRPIQLNLLGFPFKSGNQDHNVLGHLADMAEYKSLEYLDSMVTQMKGVYANTHLTIYTDGLLFNDLFEIRDQTVLGYEDSLKQLAKDFPTLKIVTFSDLLSQKGAKLQEVRAQGDAHARSSQALPPEKASLIKKRIYNEINHAGHSFSQLSARDQEHMLDRLARLVPGRMHAAGAFIKPFEGETGIHLSTHYQSDFSKKIGIKLFPNSVITPPNGVLVQEQGGTYTIRAKNQIDRSSYKRSTVVINTIVCPFFSWR